MSRKALGRGLSALLPEQNQHPAEENLLELDIDLVMPNPEQPRTRFTEENLAELAQSIRENGIIQPIVVRRKDNGKYEIVAGERRWRAAQKAELLKVPAVVKEVSDDKILEIALIENIQRQELNAVEEAKAYRKLIDTLGLTQESVAQRVGKDRVAVTNSLRLLRLPTDIQSLLEEGKLTAGHARALLSIEDKELQKQMARNVIEFTLSVRDIEKSVKRMTNGKSVSIGKKTPIAKSDANTRAAETKLRRQLATQVRIVSDGRGTGGRIEIEYYSEDDLQRVYELLLKAKE